MTDRRRLTGSRPRAPRKPAAPPPPTPWPSLVDVPGVTAGHAACAGERSGCTVVRFDRGARMSHHPCGGAVASREWGVLEPDQLAPDVHALVLTGGSAFGLATADGVMAVLAEAGIGFATPGGPVPIVVGAALWDLDGGPHRPGAEQGRAAALACSAAPVPVGAVGAGAGAKVGRGLGAPTAAGVGTSSATTGGFTVGALVVVNAFGGSDGGALQGAPLGTSTTLALVATDLPLDRAGCRGLARMASAAYARCFWPAFTPFDGDVVFAASTGQGPTADAVALTRAGAVAAQVLEAAIRAVTSAG